MTTPNPSSCILWSRPIPQCTFSKHLYKRLTDAGVQVELRVVDNFKWKWSDFDAAVTDWSILPCIIRADGVRVSDNKQLTEWIGPDPEHAKVKPTPQIPS